MVHPRSVEVWGYLIVDTLPKALHHAYMGKWESNWTFHEKPFTSHRPQPTFTTTSPFPWETHHHWPPPSPYVITLIPNPLLLVVTSLVDSMLLDVALNSPSPSPSQSSTIARRFVVVACKVCSPWNLASVCWLFWRV